MQQNGVNSMDEKQDQKCKCVEMAVKLALILCRPFSCLRLPVCHFSRFTRSPLPDLGSPCRRLRPLGRLEEEIPVLKWLRRHPSREGIPYLFAFTGNAGSKWAGVSFRGSCPHPVNLSQIRSSAVRICKSAWPNELFDRAEERISVSWNPAGTYQRQRTSQDWR